MEETIFEKISSECLQDPVKIPLKMNEELLQMLETSMLNK